MKFIITLLISLVLSYEIALTEIQDCIQKNCNAQTLACDADISCTKSVKDYNECFKANQFNSTVPFNECAGVNNKIYADLISCYKSCDFNLLLSGSLLSILLLII
ncbi:hypothetical protein pb186bvf_012608 [Paramecium bursaria]